MKFISLCAWVTPASRSGNTRTDSGSETTVTWTRANIKIKFKEESKQLSLKELFSSFHLDGQTSGFYPQPDLAKHNKQHQGTVMFSSFYLNTSTIGFYSQTKMYFAESKQKRTNLTFI